MDLLKKNCRFSDNDYGFSPIAFDNGYYVVLFTESCPRKLNNETR